MVIPAATGPDGVVVELLAAPAELDRTDETLEALLRARHGYRAAVHAVDAATLPSLTEFLG